MIPDKILCATFSDEVALGMTGHAGTYHNMSMNEHKLHSALFNDIFCGRTHQETKLGEQSRQLDEYIRKRLKSKGFGHINHNIYGGESTNIKTGVRIRWYYQQHFNEGEQCYWYTLHKIQLESRKIRKTIKYDQQGNKNVYDESYYEAFKQLCLIDGSKQDMIQFTPAVPSSPDGLFNDALETASSVVGTPLITETTRQLAQNIIASSIVEKFNKKLTDNKLVSDDDYSTVRIKIVRAKSASDNCKIYVHFGKLSCSKLEFIIGQKIITYWIRNKSWEVDIEQVALDICDPHYDPDRIADAFEKSVSAFYEYLVKSSAIKSQIKLLEIRMNQAYKECSVSVNELIKNISSATV